MREGCKCGVVIMKNLFLIGLILILGCDNALKRRIQESKRKDRDPLLIINGDGITIIPQ